MADLDDTVLDVATDRGESLLPKDLIVYAERYDDEATGGISLDRLEAYADYVSQEHAQVFDADDVDAMVERHLTDAERWAGPDAIYEVDGKYSAFPPLWHEELGGEDDLQRYVEFISEDLASGDEGAGTGAAGRGVPQPILLDAAEALGPFSRSSARAELEQLLEDGAVEEFADQHPDARVRPADTTRD